MSIHRRNRTDGLTKTQRRGLAFVRYIRENGRPMTTQELVERYNRWYSHGMNTSQASQILAKSGMFNNLGVCPQTRSTRWGVKP